MAQGKRREVRQTAVLISHIATFRYFTCDEINQALSSLEMLNDKLVIKVCPERLQKPKMSQNLVIPKEMCGLLSLTRYFLLMWQHHPNCTNAQQERILAL